ncbi:ATP-binding cassette domain-containing protein [Thermosporothrix hazakensis]|uniref:ATP-binding cassette domain-containing protein n=1 Tax=Thermosporothrix hazakensis TaxID=644383 RepID=UPI00248242DA|nr:ATP-binding cassette domain-containing protein [Thermosporothrix hazakensis]
MNTHARQITLTDDTLKKLEVQPAEPDNMPRSLEIYLQLQAKSQEALQGNEWQAVIGPNSGSLSGGRTFGRFWDILGQECEQDLRTLIEQEEALAPNAIFAELIYLPIRSRTANVATRPSQRRQDLNLTVNANQCVALVGANGAGKTTLVKLLTRLYEPSEGEILIDDIPLQEYNLQDVRRHISAIFQDFVQYASPAYDNIGYRAIEHIENKNRIVSAAEKSEVATEIETLPQGYQTILGRIFEHGQQLSGGQWQKIALARAFVRDAAIVILDEPTASIDAETETKIFDKLKEVTQDVTSLIIAHRFSTVRVADRILVLEDGRLIEDGSHEELLRLQGRYAHLFQLQAAAYQ